MRYMSRFKDADRKPIAEIKTQEEAEKIQIGAVVGIRETLSEKVIYGFLFGYGTGTYEDYYRVVIRDGIWYIRKIDTLIFIY